MTSNFERIETLENFQNVTFDYTNKTTLYAEDFHFIGAKVEELELLTTASHIAQRSLNLILSSPTGGVTVGDEKILISIPPFLDGFSLEYCYLYASVAGTTNSTVVQVRNKTLNLDMLVTGAILLTGETVSNYATINESNKIVSARDLLAVDITQVSSTSPQGFCVALGFIL